MDTSALAMPAPSTFPASRTPPTSTAPKARCNPFACNVIIDKPVVDDDAVLERHRETEMESTLRALCCSAKLFAQRGATSAARRQRRRRMVCLLCVGAGAGGGAAQSPCGNPFFSCGVLGFSFFPEPAPPGTSRQRHRETERAGAERRRSRASKSARTGYGELSLRGMLWHVATHRCVCFV